MIRCSMRKILICSVLLFFLFLKYTLSADLPQPQGWVNDFSGVISAEYKDKLNGLIAQVEEKTSAEIAVVTVDSIAPYGEIEYARLLFDNWKPGKKGKDNGVLVLLAIKERRWRIETGYGVEGILPDGLCGEIGRDYMVPYFKSAKYGQGLYQGVAVIANIITNGPDAYVKKNKFVKDDNIAAFFIIVLFLIVLGFVILGNIADSSGYNRRTGYYGGSSGGGFGGGGFGGGGFGGGGGGGGGAGGGF